MVHATDMAALWRSLCTVLYGCALLLFKNISFANAYNKFHDVCLQNPPPPCQRGTYGGDRSDDDDGVGGGRGGDCDAKADRADCVDEYADVGGGGDDDDDQDGNGDANEVDGQGYE
eukprot:9377794-Pyramimonas_sp.AAC.1